MGELLDIEGLLVDEYLGRFLLAVVCVDRVVSAVGVVLGDLLAVEQEW